MVNPIDIVVRAVDCLVLCMPPSRCPPRSLFQDALKLPCVREKLSRVNEAVQIASEGLSDEASASGGVLLMDNRVAHPISQVRGVRGPGVNGVHV